MTPDIPTSNKPSAEKKEKEEKETEKPNLMDDASFQKKVKESIAQVKTMVDEVESVTVKAEETKVVSIYKVGTNMNALVDELGPKERRIIVEKFHKEIGMDLSFFYLAMQVSAAFTKDQVEAMKKNGVTLQVVKALVTIKDEKLREKALQKAITEGLDADSIRQMKGSKGARSAANAKKQREKDKKKPPVRVFTQALDRITMVEQTLGSCTDAVSRLAECKTDDERKEALKVLIEIRKKLPDLTSELGSFMKFTDAISKK